MKKIILLLFIILCTSCEDEEVPTFVTEQKGNITFILRHDNWENHFVYKSPDKLGIGETGEFILRVPYQRKNGWIEVEGGDILEQKFIPYKHDEPLNEDGAPRAHIQATIKCTGDILKITPYTSK
jgi:hypothetical protein